MALLSILLHLFSHSLYLLSTQQFIDSTDVLKAPREQVKMSVIIHIKCTDDIAVRLMALLWFLTPRA